MSAVFDAKEMICVAELLYLLVTALVGVVTAAVIYARWHYGTLERVKGLRAVMKPAFVGGSDFFMYRRVVHRQDAENVRKYGKVFGYYEGRDPMIFVADAELIKLIMVKDFDHFHNRRQLDFGHELINEMLDTLPYEKWKLLRQTISPTLTTGKIRNMSVPMMEAIDNWVGIVKSRLEKSPTFYPKKTFAALTADVIARCVFATNVSSLDDQNSVFLDHLQGFMMEDFDPNFMVGLTLTFPFLSRFTPLFAPESLEYFREVIRHAMKTRREAKVKVHDFINCLNDLMEKVERGDPEYKRLEVTETTVMCQALLFFFAGFETTATTMTMLTYNLATHPKVQAQLLEEVDAYLQRHSGLIEHDTIQELTYMSACVQETLRMFPPLFRVDRVCVKDWVHEPSGLRIPKGMTVMVPTHQVHYNEEYYPEPNSFKPERFLPENKEKLNPYAFVSFGQGNHNCIGMRFAKEEIYLTVAKLLRDFEFRENRNTKLNFKEGRMFLIATDPFSVEAVRRR